MLRLLLRNRSVLLLLNRVRSLRISGWRDLCRSLLILRSSLLRVLRRILGNRRRHLGWLLLRSGLLRVLRRRLGDSGRHLSLLLLLPGREEMLSLLLRWRCCGRELSSRYRSILLGWRVTTLRTHIHCLLNMVQLLRNKVF